MKSCISKGLVAALAVLACGTALRAEVIAIPNGDFMSPDASAMPYAVPGIGSWQKAPAPAWWLGYGYTADQWDQTSGVFHNEASLPTYITNLTGSTQAAFLFANPGNEFYQDLTATYQVGQSYHLQFGLIASNDATPYVGAIKQGTPIAAVLYYREGDTRLPMASLSVPNAPGLDVKTLFYGFTLDSAVVQAGDPWAGKAIGVQFLSQADFTNMGGVWDIGNVVLSSTAGVPEPASLAIMAAGSLLLLRRRRS